MILKVLWTFLNHKGFCSKLQDMDHAHHSHREVGISWLINRWGQLRIILMAVKESRMKKMREIILYKIERLIREGFNNYKLNISAAKAIPISKICAQKRSSTSRPNHSYPKKIVHPGNSKISNSKRALSWTQIQMCNWHHKTIVNSTLSSVKISSQSSLENC